MTTNEQYIDDNTHQNVQIQSVNPIIDYFRLENVNGYKTIELTCEANAKIVSAENGSGKTTLLNALYGILANKHSLLSKTQFDRFSLKFHGQSELTISKNELSRLPDNIIEIAHSELGHFMEDHDLDASCLEALTSLSFDQEDDFIGSDWVQSIYRSTPYDHDDILHICRNLISENSNKSNTSVKILEYVESGLNGATVLYLPTYRRI
ncbi:hypothetical protein F9L33_01345 [Amylibacter sp. SFDW26]|uniref:hypothetical protein n=1 Tax=Amylibacter sp. SFDW26 TaxID=2652722 RepID=UPI0012614E08|nr:hypothetical protein [Amylibacter sp. SFDW26]KAB7615439.1 hypothetical protein F9L33_01345 [Amylibacter sp. SFDW26]